MKRARIAAHHHAAERGETRRVGLGNRERVGDAGDALPMNRVPKGRREARLKLARALRIERAVGNAELLRQREFTLERAKRAIAAVELEPAFLAQIPERARLRQQRFVLRHRARKQRTHRPGRRHQARGRRRSTKFEQPWCDLRQEGQVIVGFRRAFERDAQQGDGVRRKGRWKDGVALDRPRVAVGGLLARRAAIEQRDSQAALGQMQSDGGADNAGTKHDGIDACHEIPSRTPAWRSGLYAYIWMGIARGRRSIRFPWLHRTRGACSPSLFRCQANSSQRRI